MSPFLFWVFALMTLIFGAAVVINHNPVASALSLVVSFLGLAALFMSLNAYFVGIIQVLVYAGAVMVLFLFIIMLLNLQAEERRRINWLAAAGGIAVAVILLIEIFLTIGRFEAARQTFPSLSESTTDDVRSIGAARFRDSVSIQAACQITTRRYLSFSSSPWRLQKLPWVSRFSSRSTGCAKQRTSKISGN